MRVLRWASGSVRHTPLLAAEWDVFMRADHAWATAFFILCASGCVVAQPRPMAVGHSAVEAHAFQNGAWAPPPPVVAPPPPVAMSNHVGAMMAAPPGQVWVDGHFNRVADRYVWEQEHWQQPPQPGLHWQQPTWNNGQWFPGFWAGNQVPPVYQTQGPWNPGWNGPVPNLGVPALPQAQPAPATFVGPTGARTVVVP